MIVIRDVHPDHPIIVAANRDEAYARPSTPPRVLSEGPRVVAGEDAARRGTWMGAAETGLVAGLTNFHTGAPADPARRSRGELVLGALRAGTPEAAARWLRALDPRAYNPFNLLFGDASGLFVGYGRELPAIDIAEVPRGVHVLSNDSLDAPSFARVAFARAEAERIATLPWPALVPALGRILADHALPGFQAVCIHTPSFGTRSSTIIAAERGRIAHYLFAAGPPCTTPYQDVTALLAP